MGVTPPPPPPRGGFESTLSCPVLAQPIFFLQEALYRLASKINVVFGFTCT